MTNGSIWSVPLLPIVKSYARWLSGMQVDADPSLDREVILNRLVEELQSSREGVDRSVSWMEEVMNWDDLDTVLVSPPTFSWGGDTIPKYCMSTLRGIQILEIP